VLAFNLVRVGSKELPTPTNSPDDVSRKFEDLTEEWKNQSDSPEKMVLKLDHEYTNTNLSFDKLKGTDKQVVDFLKSLIGKDSKEPLLNMALCLLDRHVTGSGDDNGESYYRNRHWGHRYDDHADVGMVEILSDEIEVSTWVSAADFGQLDVVLEDELIGEYRKPSEIFGKKYKREYEGYQGNYAGTLEYWYKAAVLVFWPKSRDFELLAMDIPYNLDYCTEILEEDEKPSSELFIQRLSVLIPKVPVTSLTSTLAFINSKEHVLSFLISLGISGINSSELRHFACSRIIPLPWLEVESHVTSMISILLSKKKNLQGLQLLMELRHIYGEKYVQLLNEYLQSILLSSVEYGDLPEVVMALLESSQEASSVTLILELIIKTTLKTNELKRVFSNQIKEVGGLILKDKVLGMISVGIQGETENCMKIHLSYLQELRGNQQFFDNDVQHDEFANLCLTVAVDLIVQRMNVCHATRRGYGQSSQLKKNEITDIVCVMEMLIFHYQLSQVLFEKLLSSLRNIAVTDYLTILNSDSTLPSNVSMTGISTSGFVEMQYDMISRSRAMALTILRNNKSNHQLTSDALLGIVHWILGLNSNDLELSLIESLKSGVSDNLIDSLLNDQRVLDNIKINGNFRLIVNIRIQSLESSLPGPLFNWKLPNASCPGHVQIQNFLRGPQEKFNLTKSFTSVLQARALAKTLLEIISPRSSVTFNAAGIGKNAYLTIQKSSSVAGYDTKVVYPPSYYEMNKKITSLKSLLSTNAVLKEQINPNEEEHVISPYKKFKREEVIDLTL